ncbi:hypothetical protein [Lunatimonas salinarum]|uniref:hypothetical protein n=1 Tax=Lunatimonas salinarum TaxID=1774590 RepID=UPI001AE0246B|nr:hypothetical protein [Lunatimonas salinarum]
MGFKDILFGSFFLILIISGILEAYFNIYIVGKLGLQDLMIFICSVFYFKKIFSDRSLFRLILIFVFLFCSSLVSGIQEYGFSSVYLHFIRVSIIMFLSYLIGKKLKDGILRNLPHIEIIFLVPIILLVFWRLKFQSIGLDALTANQYYKLSNIDESISMFAWNSMGAIASILYFFFSFFGIHYKNNYVVSSSLKILLLYVIFASTSRAAITGLFIVELYNFFVIYNKKSKFKYMFLIAIILTLFSLVLQGENSSYFYSFLGDKFTGYQDNLVDVRLENIFLTGINNWYKSHFLFGDAKTWGHSTLVTVASMSGFFTLIFFIIFNFEIFRIGAKNIYDLKTRWLFFVLFFVVFFQNFVADYHFTVPYYTFISYFSLGFITGYNTRNRIDLVTLHFSRNRKDVYSSSFS